jgi:hypothetical protein
MSIRPPRHTAGLHRARGVPPTTLPSSLRADLNCTEGGYGSRRSGQKETDTRLVRAEVCPWPHCTGLARHSILFYPTAARAELRCRRTRSVLAQGQAGRVWQFANELEFTPVVLP